MEFTVPFALVVLLKASSGFFWVLAYALMIRQSKKDQISAVPLFCIWANISFEFLFSFIDPTPQKYVNAIWFFQDCVIFYLAWKYRKSSYSKHISENFVWYSMFAVPGLAFLMLYLTSHLNDSYGAYIAWTLNLIMSALFLLMAYKRSFLAGQSLGIGIAKMLGSAVLIPLVIPFFRSNYLTAVVGATLVLDLAYIGYIWLATRQKTLIKVPLPS